MIGYEPIMAPFGAQALSGLRRADMDGNLDASVEVALRDVTGMTSEAISGLRAQTHLWSELRHLSAPIYAETRALNEAPQPDALAVHADRVDLIVGERGRGREPYGTTFADIARHTPTATTHTLADQGHLAHLEAPDALAALVDGIAHHRR